MRIRKLARELGLSEQELFDLLHVMGHARYINPEQMLPIELVEQLRKRSPLPAPKATGWKPPEAREIVNLDRTGKPPSKSAKPAARVSSPGRVMAPKEVPVDGEPASRERPGGSVGAVRPTPSSAKGEPAGPGVSGVRPPSPGIAPPAPGLPAEPTRASVAPAEPAAAVAPPDPPARAPAAPQAAPADKSSADDVARLRALLGASEAELARARDRVIALERELASSENHRRALLRALATASGREAHQSVRDAFIRRGLIGDDEIALALRAWGEAHRLQELLDPLQVGNPVVFQALLDERMLLVGPGEDCPSGVVAVTVAPDRSERHTAAPVRSALARMATALLVHGKKRLVVHGGSAAWQRELKDGLDPRIDLRFYPHIGRGPLPDTGVPDVVVLWDSAVSDPRLTERHPNAMLILQRGLIPFCQAVVDQVER